MPLEPGRRRARGPAAQQVDRGPTRQREQERPHARARRIEASRGTPEADERLLDEVLGEPTVAKQVDAEAVDARAVAVVERRERLAAIACCQPRDEDRLGGGEGSAGLSAPTPSRGLPVRIVRRRAEVRQDKHLEPPPVQRLGLVLPGGETGDRDVAVADAAERARAAGGEVDAPHPAPLRPARVPAT